MAKLTTTDLASLENQTSAIQTINDNFAAVETALENTLSRDGTTPNSMGANLDMNSRRIINLAAPVDDNDAVRLIDVVDGIQGPKGDQGDPGTPGEMSGANNLSEITNPATARANIGAQAQSATLDTLAAATITAAGLALLDDASSVAQRTTLGLGDAATKNVGTTAGTVADGNDARFKQLTVVTKDVTGSLSLTEVVGSNCLRHTSASTHTWTIDPVATTAYPVGIQVTVRNATGGGAVTISRGVGVTLYRGGTTSNANVTLAAGGHATLFQEASDTWVITGTGIS